MVLVLLSLTLSNEALEDVFGLQQLQFSCRRSGFRVPVGCRGFLSLAGTNPREDRLATAGIVKALDTISAEHDINEPFDSGEVVKLAPSRTVIAKRYRDVVSRYFRLRSDIPHPCA